MPFENTENTEREWAEDCREKSTGTCKQQQEQINTWEVTGTKVKLLDWEK